MSQLSDWIEFNPRVKLEKGKQYPFIGMERLQPGNRFVSHDAERTFTGGGARFSTGDTLFARITPCLENGKIAQFVAGPEVDGFGSTEFFVLRAKSDVTDPTFVYYLAQTTLLRDTAIQSMVGASGRQRADVESLRNLEIDLPDLAQQKRIGQVLSRYDDLIEVNRHRIALLEESARLLYREWFVQLRYPGHSLSNERQALPPGWRIRPLGEVVAVNGASLSSQDKPDEIRYIDIASVETGNVLAATKMPFADAPGRARRKVQHGDVIWSCVRPNRRSYALLWQPHVDILVSTGFAVLTACDVPFSYLYFATTSDEFVAYLTNRATGAAYPAVKARDFEESSLLCPTTELLQNFHESCLPMLELRSTLMEQNTNLTEARNALLPKLMSGEIQV